MQVIKLGAKTDAPTSSDPSNLRLSALRAELVRVHRIVESFRSGAPITNDNDIGNKLEAKAEFKMPRMRKQLRYLSSKICRALDDKKICDHGPC